MVAPGDNNEKTREISKRYCFRDWLQAPSSPVIQVAGGCGEGWHRGPNGGCLRNYANPGGTCLSARFPHWSGRRCRANGY